MISLFEKLKEIVIKIALSCSNITIKSSCCSQTIINQCDHCGDNDCVKKVCQLKRRNTL